MGRKCKEHGELQVLSEQLLLFRIPWDLLVLDLSSYRSKV